MSADKRVHLDRLEIEHDNLRAALTWATSSGEVETALRLGTALWRFWQMRGYLDEGIKRLEAVVALPECAAYADKRIAALDALGGLTYWRADYTAATRYYGEVLAARRAAGDKRAIAESLYNLSFAYSFERERDTAEALILEAIDLFKELGDDVGVARSRWALGNLEYTLHNAKRARELAAQALETFERIDDAFMIGWATYTIGIADMLEGDLANAGRHYRRALAIFHDAGDVSGYTLVLDGFSAVAFLAGDRQRAAKIAGAVAALERTTGTGLNASNREFSGYNPAPLKTDPDTAAAYAEGERLSIDDAVALAMSEAE